MTGTVQRAFGARARAERRSGGLGMLPLLFAPLVGALLLAVVFGRLLEPGASANDRRPEPTVSMPPVSLQSVGPSPR